MKFALAVAALATTCFAQEVDIGFPANCTSVSPGHKVVVQVLQGVTLSSWTNLGIVIGIYSCTTTNSVCLPHDSDSEDSELGTILFKGPLHPRYPTSYSLTGVPEQNFTVTIPSKFPQGPAVLSVFHTALVGSGNMVLAETVNVTLDVTSAKSRICHHRLS